MGNTLTAISPRAILSQGLCDAVRLMDRIMVGSGPPLIRTIIVPTAVALLLALGLGLGLYWWYEVALEDAQRQPGWSEEEAQAQARIARVQRNRDMVVFAVVGVIVVGAIFALVLFGEWLARMQRAVRELALLECGEEALRWG